MTEYVPTIEEVREFISKTVWPVAEFDRWLAEVKADVWDEAVEAQLDAQSGVRGITIVVASNPYRKGL